MYFYFYFFIVHISFTINIIPLESIQINPIDVSTYRRYRRRCNQIRSKWAKVTKFSVQSGFEYTFRFNTESYGENTMLGGKSCGKSEMFNRTNQLLHSPSRVSLSGRIYCGPTVVSAKTRGFSFCISCNRPYKSARDIPQYY